MYEKLKSVCVLAVTIWAVLASCGVVYLYGQNSEPDGIHSNKSIVGKWTVTEKTGVDNVSAPESIIVFNSTNNGYWHIPKWVYAENMPFTWYKVNDTVVYMIFKQGGAQIPYELTETTLKITFGKYSISGIRA